MGIGRARHFCVEQPMCYFDSLPYLMLISLLNGEFRHKKAWLGDAWGWDGCVGGVVTFLHPQELSELGMALMGIQSEYCERNGSSFLSCFWFLLTCFKKLMRGEMEIWYLKEPITETVPVVLIGLWASNF